MQLSYLQSKYSDVKSGVGGGGGLLVASGSVRVGGDDILDPDTILCLLFSRGFCSPAVVETLKKKNPTSHR